MSSNVDSGVREKEHATGHTCARTTIILIVHLYHTSILYSTAWRCGEVLKEREQESEEAKEEVTGIGGLPGEWECVFPTT